MSGERVAISERRVAAGPVDLLDHYTAPDGFLFSRNGAGLVGVGSAAQAVVGAGTGQGLRAAAAADRLLHASSVAPGSVVVGALPFDGTVSALLTVPAQTLWRGARAGAVRDTGAEETDASTASHRDPSSAATGNGHRPGRPDAAPRADPDPGVYVAAVGEALRRIAAGELRKVVLARSLVVPTPSAAVLAEILRRLRARDPHCRLFAAPVPGSAGHPAGVVAGASPELLLRRTGTSVVSTALAGTAPRSADAAIDRAAAEGLRGSVKDAAEHRVVVEAITAALAPFCSALTVDPQPSLERTATAWHLATTVHGVLRSTAPSALALAAALHPTPAVAGTPRPAALRAIADLEPVARGFYAGFVGWVDAAGDGEWAVCLRCLEVRDSGTRLFAGAGIVAGSDPDAELAETEVKFATLLQALGEA